MFEYKTNENMVEMTVWIGEFENICKLKMYISYFSFAIANFAFSIEVEEISTLMNEASGLI